MLKRPADTAVLWSMGKSVIDAQNYLAEGMTGDWLWILGDDHQFGEAALMQLLARDVDVICPLNVMRAHPFHPLIYDESGERWTWDRLDGKYGIHDVPACGNAGMLVKRRVFDAIPQPWFEWGPDGSPYAGSDLAFCWKARQAGFKVYVDTQVRFGHIAVATFIPAPIGPEGGYGVAMQVQGHTAAYFRFMAGQQAVLFEQKGLGCGDI